MSDLPTAKVRPASNWSAIWVLPLIALLIGGWLGWRAYSQAGIDIEVFFESGDGLQAGKTEVMYKGMPIGKVTALTLDHTRGVVATIEMNKEAEPHLRSSARFWLVKPSVTLAGITGLETLLSGNYIAISPSEGGAPARRFDALSAPPPLPDDAPGLHLTLKAERLGSLNRDSPVFYRQIQVGRVKSYQLAEDQKTVEIKVFIEPDYASLVRKHTRFWNASGITVNADLSGLKVRTESLASIVAGGIAFATAEERADSPPTDPSLPFRLYEDFDAAQAGIKVTVELNDFDGLQAGRTPVMFSGIQVGTLKTLKFDANTKKAIAELTMAPQTEDHLVDGTEFWVVKPSISLGGVTGLEALVKGNYIAVRPGAVGNPPRRKFVALSRVPPLNLDAPGRHLVLFSDNLGSLQVGSPVLYRQIKVGSVQSYQLSRDRRQVLLGVHIEPDYAELVNSSSRFWNASGITLKGGLTSGVEVKSESLQTLLAGGVTFETPDLKASVEHKVQRFRLYADRPSAMQAGQEIQIRVASGDGLRPETPIRYKGLDVGKVESVELTDDLQGVLLNVRITEGGERIARAGTQFWVVKPELGLLRTANLETLISGQYLQVRPADQPGPRQTQFTALAEEPAVAMRETGLSLVLSASRLGSIKEGVPVTFREVKVGKVTGVALGSQADQVLIRVLIEPRYAPLVRTGSRFWNASGIGVDAGLFKGVKLRTDSLESLLAGGIAFATPEGSTPAKPGQTFPLFTEAQDEWLLWTPKIPLGK
ncbi:hypothetical protein D9M69_366550 [compost metagenome]